MRMVSSPKPRQLEKSRSWPCFRLLNFSMYLITGMCIPFAKAPDPSLTARSSTQRAISCDSGHLCEAITRSFRDGMDSQRLSVDICFLLACGTYLYPPAKRHDHSNDTMKSGRISDVYSPKP